MTLKHKKIHKMSQRRKDKYWRIFQPDEKFGLKRRSKGDEDKYGGKIG